MNKLLIITGGNKGIGKGIVQAYLTNDYQVISLARGKNEDSTYQNVKQISIDLSDVNNLEKHLTSIFDTINTDKLEGITLINNAGSLGKIGKIEDNSSLNIIATVQLNTTAPLILASCFINLTKKLTCKKSIINISSGAAYKPYFGWTVYCATKAAIDMMTKTIAIEQETEQNAVKIIAIYPGVVDTDMQGLIRQSLKADFANIDRFLELKASNSLADPRTVGRKIFELDHDDSLANGELIRIE